jgi:hypothetical protein
MKFIVENFQTTNTVKSICELLDRPLGGEIYIEVSRYSGVRMSRRKTCMCGPDWSL